MSSDCEKLRGLKTDSTLNFNEYLYLILKETSRKVDILARVTSYISLNKRGLLISSLFSLQFHYCPLVWMFNNRAVPERSFFIVYSMEVVKRWRSNSEK